MRITAVPTERIYAGRRPEASHAAESYRFIPGSVVLGAFAATWIREFGPPQARPNLQAEFRSLFHGEVIWPALHGARSVLVPLSARVCKYGFESADSACASYASDLVVTLDPAGPAPGSAGTPVRGRCPHCGGPLENGKGQIRDVTMASTTRVRLESMRGAVPDGTGRRERAKDGDLFTRTTIERQTALEGTAPDVRHPWLVDLASRDDVRVWIGGKRTVGGRCSAAVSFGGAMTSPPRSRPDGHIVLTTKTPAVFTDDAGRPRLDPDIAELCSILDCQVDIVGRWVRPTVIGGWHLLTGLPKPEEIAAQQGSTWVLAPHGVPTPERLADLTHLGLRTHEGFGHMMVNPPPFSLRPATITGAPASPATPGETRVHTLADQISVEFKTDPKLIYWVIDFLRQRAVELSSGSTGTFDEMRSRASYARLRDRQAGLLDQIITELPAAALVDLVTQLEFTAGSENP